MAPWSPRIPLLVGFELLVLHLDVGNKQAVKKSFVEEEMHGETWPSLKRCDSICHEAWKAVCGNPPLRMQVKRSLSESANYKIRVVGDVLMSALKYDKLTLRHL